VKEGGKRHGDAPPRGTLGEGADKRKSARKKMWERGKKGGGKKASLIQLMAKGELRLLRESEVWGDGCGWGKGNSGEKGEGKDKLEVWGGTFHWPKREVGKGCFKNLG